VLVHINKNPLFYPKVVFDIDLKNWFLFLFFLYIFYFYIYNYLAYFYYYSVYFSTIYGFHYIFW